MRWEGRKSVMQRISHSHWPIICSYLVIYVVINHKHKANEVKWKKKKERGRKVVMQYRLLDLYACVLVVTVGQPFHYISSFLSVVQRWFSRVDDARRSRIIYQLSRILESLIPEYFWWPDYSTSQRNSSYILPYSPIANLTNFNVEGRIVLGLFGQLEALGLRFNKKRESVRVRVYQKVPMRNRTTHKWIHFELCHSLKRF